MMYTLYTDERTGNSQITLDGHLVTIPVEQPLPQHLVVLSGHSGHHGLRQGLRDNNIITGEVVGGLPSDSIPLELYELSPGYDVWDYDKQLMEV